MYNLELKPNRRHFWNSHSMLEKELDKFFDTFNKPEEYHAPACEILDQEKQYSLSMDIPGLRQEDISIEVKENQLFVTGERKFEAKAEKENVLKSERRYGKFQRVFTLPQNVNADTIQASFENGVLDIILPKEEKAQARKIAIGAKAVESALKN